MSGAGGAGEVVGAGEVAEVAEVVNQLMSLTMCNTPSRGQQLLTLVQRASW